MNFATHWRYGPTRRSIDGLELVKAALHGGYGHPALGMSDAKKFKFLNTELDYSRFFIWKPIR